jgi:hypothetical protein
MEIGKFDLSRIDRRKNQFFIISHDDKEFTFEYQGTTHTTRDYLSKGIKEYNPDNFDHDKQVAERVAVIQNQLRRNGRTDVDQDAQIDDAIDDMNLEREIDLDNAMDMNPTDDFDDGDPWGDEVENRDEYD